MNVSTKIISGLLVCFVLHFSGSAQSKYYPQGDPKKFQVQVTVPLWLPWISGQAGVSGMIKEVEGDINASPADLVNSLKGALMLNADFSKGHTIGFVNYMHLVLETPTTQVNPQGRAAYSWSAKIKNDVLDIAAGGRFYFPKGMVDPFVGVRYFSLNNTLSLKDSASSKSKSSTIDYWDPFFGARVYYYPADRWMLFLRTDFGGIWGGSSEFSWNIEAKVGYAISPTIDLSAGFRTWSFKYAEYTEGTKIFYMAPHFYGFEIGASFFIPTRKKDGNIFPNKK